MFKHLYLDEDSQKVNLDLDTITEEMYGHYSTIEQYVIDTPYYLNENIENGNSILFEGAQGTGLDIDFGSYPFVTSSSCTSGGAAIGSGVSFKNISDIIGVFKVYITRVGEGALPTRLADKDMEILREFGGEFGATTGRPRDCGWFDGVQAKYSIMVNGITSIALTKIDIFDKYKKVYFCTDYDVDGEITNRFPTSSFDMDKAKPVYKEFDGWLSDTTGITDKNDLPKEAKEYLDFLQDYLKTPISILSNGPKRDNTIIY